ncbi:MAG: hypothetical protein AAFX03_05695 [Pseudomonadota bacterium]
MKTPLLAAAALMLAPFAAATEINIGYSDAFYEKLEYDFGLREGDVLVKEVREDLERQLDKRGVSPALIEVTILDAKPNRPTIKQLGDRPGLDFSRSISRGGMDLIATAFDENGEEIGTIEYEHFERDVDQIRGSTTWFEARRASGMFARKVAKSLDG